MNLKEIREARSLTRAQLAALAGTTPGSVARIEAGGQPSVALARKLGAALCVPWAAFFGEERSLEEKVDGIAAMLEALSLSARLPQVVTVSDIMRIEGVSKTQILCRERYLLPDFGRSAYPRGKKRWPISQYLEWRAVPAAERMRMLDESKEETE